MTESDYRVVLAAIMHGAATLTHEPNREFGELRIGDIYWTVERDANGWPVITEEMADDCETALACQEAGLFDKEDS